MRCQHCSGELPPSARFCGVCGHNVKVAPAAPPEEQWDSPSLFELPVNPGARAAKILFVLFLNLLLAGAGVAMMIAYWQDRKQTVSHDDESVPIGGASSPSTIRPDVVNHATSASPRPAAAGNGTLEKTRSESDTASGRASREVAAVANPRVRTKPEVAAAVAPAPTRTASASTAASSAKPEVTSGSTDPSTPQPPGTATDVGSGGATPAQEPTDSATSAPTDTGDSLDRLARQINVQVQRQSPALMRCYEQSAKAMTPGEPLSGRVEVRFTVQPDGSTREARAERNTTDSGQLADCVVGLVRGWTFPAGLSEPADFLWPFEFQAP